MLRIVTDSTCDMPLEKAKELGIDILPLSVLFGEKEYKDRVDLFEDEFYELLKNADSLPTTAQVNPDAFRKIFESYIENGDEVICITIAAKLSGTYQSAVIARELLGSDKIHIIDSQTVTAGALVLISEAVKLRDMGKSASEIVPAINELKSAIRIYAKIPILKYLKMGGRISPAAAMIGGALGIIPVIMIEDGEISVVGKGRGNAQADKIINSEIEKNQIHGDYSVVFAHACDLENGEEFKKSLCEKFQIASADLVGMGPVIGTHAGPGAVGLAYAVKQKIIMRNLHT